MRHDEPPRVYAAPEPVLGLVASVVSQNEARLRRTARAAMGFALASAAGSAIVVTALVVEIATKLHHSRFDVLFGILMMLTPVTMLIGLILGIIARKNQTGKAAILVSLIPLGLVTLLLLGSFATLALSPR